MSEISSLSKELQFVAEAELNEKPDQINDELKELKEWLNHKPHLKSRFDDRYLVVFLRACKHNLERTKSKLEEWYKRQIETPDILSNQLITPEILKYTKLGVFLPLRQPISAAGPAVLLMRSGIYDTRDVNFDQMLKAFAMMLETMLYENSNAVVAGCILLYDSQYAAISHAAQFTPKITKDIASATNVMPVRMKGIYLINTKALIRGPANILKKFLSAKLQERLKIFGNDIDSFDKLVPREILPQEYGGKGGTIDEITDYWVEMLRKYEKNLANFSLHIKDETPFGCGKFEHDFGAHGSFKQLNID